VSEPIVLLVEDDDILRLTEKKQFTKLGLICHVAATGAEALERSRVGYDLICMDIGLPDINGIEVARRIRKEEEESHRKRTPIIALTALSNDKDKCLEAGMDDFLLKPVDYDKLVTIINRYLPKIGA
jgi:CheY-like chemotaxis protein